MTSQSINIKDYRTEIPGKLSDDKTTWVFPNVSTVVSSGKTSNWQIKVRMMKDGEFMLIDDYMFDNQPLAGFTGWIKVDTGLGDTISKRVPTIVKTGKNLGRVSATNVFTQALRDAYGLYNKQLKKANNTVNILYPPMLAQVYKDQKTPPVISESSPVYMQPKFNGVRCVTTLNDGVIMYSRRKNIYPGFSYIKDELAPILKKYHDAGRKLYLDGELYKHGTALQDISGYARREDKDDDIKLNYMVYDCFIIGEPLLYSARKAILDEIFESNTSLKYTQAVATYKVTDMTTIETLYKQFLEFGYEGAMIRKDSLYMHSYNESHSKVLLKMKPTYDAELEIADYTVGKKGKAAGALMIMCRVNDVIFPVTPAMELPERIALANKMGTIEPNGKTHFVNHWLGKKIIVEYDELSKDNIPQRARTKLQIRTWD